MIQEPPRRFDRADPLAATYSILARDPATGEMGAAVQSHWFSVGTVVIWGEAGLGVVATQSFVNPSFGRRGLGLLRRGRSPAEAVEALISSDPGREVRQLAIMDRDGHAAVHTGARCIPAAGHMIGRDHSVQANMMGDDRVWPAMSEAFLSSEGHLVERMICALEAAESVGGDIRGRQSAALLVVKGRSSRKPWADRTVDLRVDDHQDPVRELRRLWDVHRAYECMDQGDQALEKGDMVGAERHYRMAEELFPDNVEMSFWHAVALFNNNRPGLAEPILIEVFARDRNYVELARRIVELGMLKMARERLQELARRAQRL